jgi:hypothetical protein
MDRDIFRCQKMKKVASGVVLYIDSCDLHDNRFFVENELESLFFSRSLVVSFSTHRYFFPVVRFGGHGLRYLIYVRDFIHNCIIPPKLPLLNMGDAARKS